MNRTRTYTAIIAAFFMAFAVSIPQAAALTDPVLFSSHPDILSVTEGSNDIHDLAVVGDRLYEGHGDYGGNTGPLSFAWVSISTGVTGSDYVYPGEELNTFRVFDGVLYAPNVDPRGGNQPGGFGTPAGYVNGPMMAHTFDMVKFNGALYIVGSNEESDPKHGAAVHRSTDGGATWTQVLTIVDNPYTGYERFYYIVVAGGKMFVQAAHKGYDPNGGVVIVTDPFSVLFPLMSSADGIRWSKVSNRASLGLITAGSQVESFGGKMWASNGRVSDGKQAVDTRRRQQDLFVAGDRLYGVTSDGTVAYTTGAASWTVLPGKCVPVGAAARSIAVVNDMTFCGDDQGRVWKS